MTVLQKLIIAKFNDHFMHEISTVNYPTNFSYAKLVVQGFEFSVFETGPCAIYIYIYIYIYMYVCVCVCKR